MIRGIYGRQPSLPCVPGFEGVGIVEEGSGILAWRVKNKRVAVLNGNSGNWQEHVIIPARQAVPVPDDLTDEQAANFFVNPTSALAMTRYVLNVPRDAWLLQTAAASQLGHGPFGSDSSMPAKRQKHRPSPREQAEELLHLGGTAAVATNDESLLERIQKLTNGDGIRYAIDAVGGATGTQVISTLGRGGRLLVYGTLAHEPITIDPRVLLAGQKCVEGFWLSEWVRDQGVLTMLRVFRKIGQLMRGGTLTTEVGKTICGWTTSRPQ